MEKNILNNYITKRLNSIEQNLFAYAKNLKPAYLHRLRVDIKKISAVISFAGKVYNKKYNADILKPLFHKAGRIREIQVIIRLLNAFPKPPERLITLLKKKENKLAQQFIKNEFRYKRQLTSFHKKNGLPETLPHKKTIESYFKKAEIKTKKLVRNKDRESLHQFRMKLKKLNYIYNALPQTLLKKITFNEEEIKKKQEMLGKWHDIYSAITFLSHERIPKKSVQSILKMKVKEKKQFEAFFTK